MILLDTHVLLWWASQENKRISAPGLRAIQQEPGEIAIAAISAWEIAMLVDRQRITLTMSAHAWFSIIGQDERVRFIPMDNTIAIDAQTLPGNFHRDPADRIIVATARRLNIPLITMDKKIRAYPHVRTLW